MGHGPKLQSDFSKTFVCPKCDNKRHWRQRHSAKQCAPCYRKSYRAKQIAEIRAMQGQIQEEEDRRFLDSLNKGIDTE